MLCRLHVAGPVAFASLKVELRTIERPCEPRRLASELARVHLGHQLWRRQRDGASRRLKCGAEQEQRDEQHWSLLNG